MNFLQRIYGVVWGVPALFLVLSVGLVLSIRTGFFQLRLLPASCRLFLRRSFGKSEDQKGTTSFQALCTALAATVGTGNLAGVAGAITIGGPGSIFWMWLCGVLGMIIKCAEATLAVCYRRVDSGGETVGGPMYMITGGLPGKYRFLAGIYAFFGVVAAFGVGNATQINTVVSGVEGTMAEFGTVLPAWGKLLLALLLTGLVGAILLGGAKRIGAMAERLVPFAAGLYLLMGAFVLLLRAGEIPHAFASIIRGAFSPGAVTGGTVGSVWIVLRTGISRGVFTNEAGMGTASIAHAAAHVAHPLEQGMMGIVEVFLDTLLICTMTALVILCSGVTIPYGADMGVRLTTQAFSAVLGTWSGLVITLSLCLFAFATVLGWGLYGIRCAQFLFGRKAWKPFVLLQIITVFFGALLHADMLWLFAEIINGLMAIPNLFTLWVLMPQFIRIINVYKMKMHGGTYENFHQCQSL